MGEEVIGMPQWKLKNCPRCLGDTFVDSDRDGWYEECLQCSYRRELKNFTKFEKHPVPVTGVLVKR